jgi:hypothetical protein
MITGILGLSMGADLTQAYIDQNRAKSKSDISAMDAFVSQLSSAVSGAGYHLVANRSYVPEDSVGNSSVVWDIALSEYPDYAGLVIDNVPSQDPSSLAGKLISEAQFYYQVSGRIAQGAHIYTTTEPLSQAAKEAPPVYQAATPPPASTVTPTVALDNLTRPGSSFFYVGEQFRVTVQGAPGQPVSVTAGSTSQPTSTASYGATNAQGLFSVEGQMGNGEIGTWHETWRVGDVPARPNLEFEVKEAQKAAASPPKDTTGTGAGAGAGAGGAGGASGAGAGAGAGSFNLTLPSNIPTWAYLAGGGLLLFLLVKR